MNRWQRWVHAPQTLGFRRCLFQVHLWAGIGLGLYVLAISLSGSALLLKSPFYAAFEPKYLEPPPDAVALEDAALRARMAEVYAGYEVGFTMPPFEPDRAFYVVLNRDGEYFPHYFNHFTGEDLGSQPLEDNRMELIGPSMPGIVKGRDTARFWLSVNEVGRPVGGAMAPAPSIST
jgi:uncharacterized iron-regulated membrane protein